MKYAKLIFFGIIILLAIIGYSRYFLCDMPPPPNPQVIVDDWSKPLNEGGYKPATVTKPDHIPGDKLPETVEAVIYAEGSTSEHEVEISVVTSPDDVVWIKAVIDNEVVKWRKVEYMTQPKPESNRDWSLLACGRFSNGLDFGAGVAWQPLQFMGTKIGISAIVDINETITDKPDWISINARLSRSFGAFNYGADIGYCLGDEQGLNVGVSVGVAVGL